MGFLNKFFGYKTSLYDRKFHYQKLLSLLPLDKDNSIELIYKLEEIEANNNNFNEIERLILSKNYWKLSNLDRKMTYISDEFGETLGCDIYELFLIINKKNEFKILVVFISIISSHNTSLEKVYDVEPFWFKIYFNKRNLIYPFQKKL